MHQQWSDKLSEYLDGELSEDERRAVAGHLQGCANCTAVLNDLKRVVARARGVAAASRPPAANLWAGICTRIEAPRHVTFTLPQLAAAAVLAAAVSGGIVWQVARSAERPGHSSPAIAAAGTTPRADPAQGATAGVADGTPGFNSGAERTVSVAMADAQYDAAVSDLEKALKQGRGRLDAATIGIVEHNLEIIDRAIDQARDALAADPANTYLSGHLVEARRRKLDLLRRAAALSDTN